MCRGTASPQAHRRRRWVDRARSERQPYSRCGGEHEAEGGTSARPETSRRASGASPRRGAQGSVHVRGAPRACKRELPIPRPRGFSASMVTGRRIGSRNGALTGRARKRSAAGVSSPPHPRPIDGCPPGPIGAGCAFHARRNASWHRERALRATSSSSVLGGALPGSGH